MNASRWIALGALAGALTVVFGAFGAHALKERLDAEQLAWWETAVQYQAYHSIALVLFGLLRERRPGGGAAGWCFLAGVLLFSGTLYAMALGGPRWLGAVTPLGGTALIVGWVVFALAGLRARASAG
jgi:uncharacterized membrane protein YgdD (TMEM256/DUF423 family)